MNNRLYPDDTNVWENILGQKIEELLPHRPPLRLIDSARIRLEPEPTEIIGVYEVQPAICAGHFPALAIFPGVLWQEMLNQLAALAVAYRRGQPVEGAYYRTEEAQVLVPAFPGDTLSLLASIDARSGRRMLWCSGRGWVTKPDGRRRLAFSSKEQLCVEVPLKTLLAR